MCALRAGQRGRRVLLLEHADKVGKKILISGGGRCNFTNLGSRPEAFLSANPHFCKSALARYTQHDFIALVEQAPHRLAREDAGPALLRRLGAADRGHAAGRMRRRRRRGEGGASHHRHRQGRSFHRGDGPRRVHLAVAGARDGRPVDSQDGRDRLRARHRAPLRPQAHRDAAGAGAADAEGAGAERRVAGGGDAAVAAQASARPCCSPIAGCRGRRSCRSRPIGGDGQEIAIDLLPDIDAASFLKERKRTRPKAELRTVLAEVLPQRLAQHLAAEGTMANLRDRDLDALAERLKAWKIVPSGTEGYAKAEVTVGGVDTDELSSRTMEAQEGAGPVRDRRSGRRHRLAGRLQFPVGVVERLGGRRGGLTFPPHSRVARGPSLSPATGHRSQR